VSRRTKKNNKYVIVIQDYLTKWPLAYPFPDQKATTLACVLVDEVIPFVGVPEVLLSDRRTNLLSQRYLCHARDQQTKHHCVSPTVQWHGGAI